MIEFDCPECGHPVEVPDAVTGDSQTCPNCGAAVEIPDDLARDAATEPVVTLRILRIRKWVGYVEYSIAGFFIIFLAFALAQGLPKWEIYSMDKEHAFVQTIRHEFFAGKAWTEDDYDNVVEAYRKHHWLAYMGFVIYFIVLLGISAAIPSIAIIQVFKRYRRWQWREKVASYFRAAKN